MSEDFSNIKKGLPAENTVLKTRLRLIIIFVVVGSVLAVLILFYGLLFLIVKRMFGIGDSVVTGAFSKLLVYIANIISSSFYTGSIALLVGIIQAWFLRKKLRSNSYIFAFSLGLGGIIGGWPGGLIWGYFDNNRTILISIISFGQGQLNSTFNIIWAVIVLFIVGFCIGLVVGAFTGGIGSIFQNVILYNSRYAWSWFFYSLISWIPICGLGWAISMISGEFSSFPFFGDALASMFMLISHGFVLNFFLYLFPKIEFS